MKIAASFPCPFMAVVREQGVHAPPKVLIFKTMGKEASTFFNNINEIILHCY